MGFIGMVAGYAIKSGISSVVASAGNKALTWLQGPFDQMVARTDRAARETVEKAVRDNAELINRVVVPVNQASPTIQWIIQCVLNKAAFVYGGVRQSPDQIRGPNVRERENSDAVIVYDVRGGLERVATQPLTESTEIVFNTAEDEMLFKVSEGISLNQQLKDEIKGSRRDENRMELLIKLGADLNPKEEESPLIPAILNMQKPQKTSRINEHEREMDRKKATILFLLNQGALPNTPLEHPSPLITAIKVLNSLPLKGPDKGKMKDIIQRLLKQGANPNRPDSSEMYPVVHALLCEATFPDPSGDKMASTLCVADFLHGDHFDPSRIQLNVNVVGNERVNPPLIEMILQLRNKKNIELKIKGIKWLLGSYFSPNSCNARRKTAVGLALLIEPNVVPLLIKYDFYGHTSKADLNLLSGQFPPITWAILCKQETSVKLLLEAKARTDIGDAFGCTPEEDQDEVDKKAQSLLKIIERSDTGLLPLTSVYYTHLTLPTTPYV